MNPQAFREWLQASEAKRRALVMGVLNVTPDSFSDGGRFSDVELAVTHAREMVEAGADLLDVGGESTRPGSLPVAPEEQIRRVVPVVRAIAGLQLPVTISVDTTRASVAEAALDAGAHLINDVSAGRDDGEMFPLAARRNVPIILMHMRGSPATMQDAPKYSDVTREVIGFLNQRLAAAVGAGVDPSHVLIDPGIGFGKTDVHNLELLRRLNEIRVLGRPIVLGTSRKGFIGRITSESDPARRTFGTGATIAWGIANGARVLRVHDVSPMLQVVQTIEAIQRAGTDRDG